MGDPGLFLFGEQHLLKKLFRFFEFLSNNLGGFPYFLMQGGLPLAPLGGSPVCLFIIWILIKVLSNMASMCGPPRPVRQYRDLMEVKGLVRSIEVSNAYYPHTGPGRTMDSARGKYKI